MSAKEAGLAKLTEILGMERMQQLVKQHGDKLDKNIGLWYAGYVGQSAVAAVSSGTASEPGRETVEEELREIVADMQKPAKPEKHSYRGDIAPYKISDYRPDGQRKGRE